MPIATESLIAPASPGAKPPLKKSTVAWIAGVVFAVAAIGVTVPALIASGKSEPPPKATGAAANVPVGQPGQIDAEFERVQAARAAAVAKAAASAARAAAASTTNAPGTPLPPETGSPTMAGVPKPVPASPVPSSARREDNSGSLYGSAAEDEKAAGATEIEAAARKSKSLMHDFSGDQGAAATTAAGGTGRRTDPTSVAALLADPGRANTGGDANRAREALLKAATEGKQPSTTIGPSADRNWVKELGQDAARTAPPLKTYKVRNAFTLLQGKVIPAVLTRELNSDLPGLVTACTTVAVYDSISGDNLLIPRGSCFYGQYSNSVAPGQSRLLFAFTRLMLPDGTAVDLPGNMGSDLAGAAGLSGDVNNHLFKMFGSSLFVALLADWAEKGKQPPQTSLGGAGGAISAAGQVLVDVSKSVLDRNRSIPPTITVPKGTRLNVEVTRDIEFAGAYMQRTQQ